MKKLLVLLFVCSPAFAATSLTFTSAVVTKQTGPGNWHFLVHRDVAEWCSGYGHGLQFGAFQAARDFDALGDGLYTCNGEFVAAPGTSAAQIFALSGCVAADPVAMKKSCPPVP
jgi:hypothetical protein